MHFTGIFPCKMDDLGVPLYWENPMPHVIPRQLKDAILVLRAAALQRFGQGASEVGR